MSLQEICPVKGNALSGECFPTKFLFPYSTNKTKVLSFFFHFAELLHFLLSPWLLVQIKKVKLYTFFPPPTPADAGCEHSKVEYDFKFLKGMCS